MFFQNPSIALETLAQTQGFANVATQEFAHYLDENDPLKDFRQKFFLEPGNLYFCGNSLGMPPKKAKEYLNEVFDNWAKLGVHTHFTGKFGAAFCDKPGLPYTEELVGAITDEVALLNGLTVNLHFLLQAFYKPTSQRWKILIEDHAFPSDRYAVWSQVEHHGYDKDAVIIAKPRENEETFRTEDILEILKQHGQEIAVVLLPGIQYYTGQLFDMPKITLEAQKLGCIVGWDLAHAVGNVKLALHDWNVDFAAWCSYKVTANYIARILQALGVHSKSNKFFQYLNSSPGGISGIFVHSRYFDNPPENLTGWWSNKCETRFQMNFQLDKGVGAAGFRVSNPPPFLLAPNYASLEVSIYKGCVIIMANVAFSKDFP